MKKIYFVWIGGIGVSALARYYHSIGYEVYGSDSTSSRLIEDMLKEGIHINVWVHPEVIDKNFEQVIYTEAVPSTHEELITAENYHIPIFSYPEALAKIVNEKKLHYCCRNTWKIYYYFSDKPYFKTLQYRF